jgi:hypothetical protein
MLCSHSNTRGDIAYIHAHTLVLVTFSNNTQIKIEFRTNDCLNQSSRPQKELKRTNRSAVQYKFINEFERTKCSVLLRRPGEAFL